MLNIHHLELFYFVARHGGITEAVRHMPYGIQQPAVSGQIIALEESLGKPLFRRRPFQLTPAGDSLFQFVRPFFENLDSVEARLRGNSGRLIRIAASSPVLKSHLPTILMSLKQEYPDLRFTLHEAVQPEIDILLRNREIDLAVTILDGPSDSDLTSEKLIELSLLLLAPAKSKIKSAEDLWRMDPISEPLIGLPERQPLVKQFASGLQKRGITWRVRIEVTTIELIEVYVSQGFGFGLTVAIPGQKHRAGVRPIPLPGFDPIQIAAVWRGDPDPLLKALVSALRNAATALSLLDVPVKRLSHGSFNL